MAGTEQHGVQIDPAAVDDGDHSPVAAAGLSVILIREGLRANGTRSGRELLRLRVARLSHLWRVHEGKTDSRGAHVERVPVDDVGHGVREAGGSAFALWIVSGGIAR